MSTKTMDKEALAITRILRILGELPRGAAQRVSTYVHARCFSAEPLNGGEVEQEDPRQMRINGAA